MLCPEIVFKQVQVSIELGPHFLREEEGLRRVFS